MERDVADARDASGDADAPLGRDEPDVRAEDDPASMPLLASEETASFDVRWREVQVAFVDEPPASGRTSRPACRGADGAPDVELRTPTRRARRDVGSRR